MLLLYFITALMVSINTSSPTRSPHPTSKSGVPDLTLVFCSVIGAILFIILSVLFLCFKRSDDDIPEKMNAPLLEKEV